MVWICEDLQHKLVGFGGFLGFKANFKLTLDRLVFLDEECFLVGFSMGWFYAFPKKIGSNPSTGKQHLYQGGFVLKGAPTK